MTFQHLLDGAEFLSQSGNPDVTSVEYDSRRVKPGCAFVAMHGENVRRQPLHRSGHSGRRSRDRHRLAQENPREGVAWALVPHGRRALARVSENFYKHPAETDGDHRYYGNERQEHDRVSDRSRS